MYKGWSSIYLSGPVWSTNSWEITQGNDARFPWSPSPTLSDHVCRRVRHCTIVLSHSRNFDWSQSEKHMILIILTAARFYSNVLVRLWQWVKMHNSRTLNLSKYAVMEACRCCWGPVVARQPKETLFDSQRGTTIESILTFGPWYGNLDVQNKRRLDHIVNVASKIMGWQQLSLSEIYLFYWSCCCVTVVTYVLTVIVLLCWIYTSGTIRNWTEVNARGVPFTSQGLI